MRVLVNRILPTVRRSQFTATNEGLPREITENSCIKRTPRIPGRNLLADLGTSWTVRGPRHCRLALCVLIKEKEKNRRRVPSSARHTSMANLAAASTSALLEELKRRVFCADKKEKRSIIFGPPGAGKGTQRCVCTPHRYEARRPAPRPAPPSARARRVRAPCAVRARRRTLSPGSDD